jgi:RNA polymerase sigma factor (sigma-70 family)
VLTNAAALTRLLLYERAPLLRAVARIVGSVSVAEDVTQGLWLRIQRVHDDPPIANKRAYLYRLARNLAVDHVRSSLRDEAVLAPDAEAQHVASAEPSAEARLIDQERLHRIAATIEQLPPRCREVFTAIRLDELSVAETATKLGISEDMVRKHIRHALRLCHQALVEAS